MAPEISFVPAENNSCLANPLPAAAVDLGTAGNYVILTKSGISTVPQSAITGDIAVSPIAATAMTGFSLTLHSSGLYSTSTQVTGQCFGASYAGSAADLTIAVLAMQTAYTDASSRSTTQLNLFAGIFNDNTLTLTPGVYTFTTNVNIYQDITFEGEENDVFIIQTTGSVIMASAVSMLLDGPQASNIFWQVAGQVTVGTTAHMEGIILTYTAAVFNTGSSLNGRILAQTACTLQMATITMPSVIDSSQNCDEDNGAPTEWGIIASSASYLNLLHIGNPYLKPKHPHSQQRSFGNAFWRVAPRRSAVPGWISRSQYNDA